MYSIHASMEASEIAGVPWSEKSNSPLTLCLPVGVSSVTVPVIVTLDPSAGTVWGAATVVLLNPGAKQYISMSWMSATNKRPSAMTGVLLIGSLLGQHVIDHSIVPLVRSTHHIF